MYVINTNKETEKILIRDIKKQYEDNPFLSQEQIDILVQKLKAVLE